MKETKDQAYFTRKMFISSVLPAPLAAVGMALAEMGDTILVGHILGVDGLAAVGGGGIDGVTGGIGDVHQGVAREALDGDGAVVAGAHGVGEGVDLGERVGDGVGGGAAVDLQAAVGADEDFARALVDAEGHDAVREEGAVRGGEVLQLVHAVGREEVEAATGGADPLAVGAVDGDGGDALVGHQVFVKIAVGDGDIVAVDG